MSNENRANENSNEATATDKEQAMTDLLGGDPGKMEENLRRYAAEKAASDAGFSDEDSDDTEEVSDSADGEFEEIDSGIDLSGDEVTEGDEDLDVGFEDDGDRSSNHDSGEAESEYSSVQDDESVEDDDHVEHEQIAYTDESTEDESSPDDSQSVEETHVSDQGEQEEQGYSDYPDSASSETQNEETHSEMLEPEDASENGTGGVVGRIKKIKEQVVEKMGGMDDGQKKKFKLGSIAASVLIALGVAGVTYMGSGQEGGSSTGSEAVAQKENGLRRFGTLSESGLGKTDGNDSGERSSAVQYPTQTRRSAEREEGRASWTSGTNDGSEASGLSVADVEAIVREIVRDQLDSSLSSIKVESGEVADIAGSLTSLDRRVSRTDRQLESLASRLQANQEKMETALSELEEMANFLPMEMARMDNSAESNARNIAEINMRLSVLQNAKDEMEAMVKKGLADLEETKDVFFGEGADVIVRSKIEEALIDFENKYLTPTRNENTITGWSIYAISDKTAIIKSAKTGELTTLRVGTVHSSAGQTISIDPKSKTVCFETGCINN